LPGKKAKKDALLDQSTRRQQYPERGGKKKFKNDESCREIEFKITLNNTRKEASTGHGGGLSVVTLGWAEAGEGKEVRKLFANG